MVGWSSRSRRATVTVTAVVLAALLIAGPGAGAQDGSSTTTEPPDTTSTSTSTPPSTTEPEVEDPPPPDPAEPPGEGTAPTTTTQPTRGSTASLVPPPLDLSSIEQLAGVRRADAVAKAQQLADGFNAKAMEAAASAVAVRDAALSELGAAEQAVSGAQELLVAAEERVEVARRRISALAIEAYQLVMTDDPAVFLPSLTLSIEGYERTARTSSYSDAAAAALRRQRSGAEEEAEAAAEAVKQLSAVRDERKRNLERAEGELANAVEFVEAVAADGLRRVEDAKATGTALTAGSRGPAILGVSVVPAKYMAEFVRLRGRPHPSVDVEALAEHFIAEGDSEGVTGDIAWAQSILETGWFNFGGSMVRAGDHNYAGIGACDSCSSGHGYPSPQSGARAQIQLLRTYAQDGLTTAQLANPPAGRSPEAVRVRGCCATWMELTGVWATAGTYGVRILEIYNELLVFAAARQRQDLAMLAVAQAASQAAQPTVAPADPTAPG